MQRNSIKCTQCASQDFEVQISIVPCGVSLLCNSCGRITPLIVSSADSFYSADLFAINGENSMKLYNESYTRNVSSSEFRETVRKDKKEQKERKND